MPPKKRTAKGKGKAGDEPDKDDSPPPDSANQSSDDQRPPTKKLKLSAAAPIVRPAESGGQKAKNICSVPGCGKSTTRKELCNSHYHKGLREAAKKAAKAKRVAEGEEEEEEDEDGDEGGKGKGEKICSVPGCGKRHSAKGFCRSHYQKGPRAAAIKAAKAKKAAGGDVDGEDGDEGSGKKICSVPGCGKGHHLKGMCRSHYDKDRKAKAKAKAKESGGGDDDDEGSGDGDEDEDEDEGRDEGGKGSGKKICSVLGCDRESTSGGMCAKHYESDRRARKRAERESGGGDDDDGDKRLCSVLGCGKVHHSKGLCSQHYGRQKYKKSKGEEVGEDYEGLEPAEGKKFCSVPDCGKAHLAKGLCSMHYKQQWRPNEGSGEDPCLVTGCNRDLYAEGMCEHHYKKQEKKKRAQKCSVEGCTNLGERKGGLLCHWHHKEQLKKENNRECSYPGCDKLSMTKRLCEKHYCHDISYLRKQNKKTGKGNGGSESDEGSGDDSSETDTTDEGLGGWIDGSDGEDEDGDDGSAKRCSVSRCNRPVYADGLCPKHHSKATADKKGKKGFCPMPGCGINSLSATQPLCKTCFSSLCGVMGCTKKAGRRGFCEDHGEEALSDDESGEEDFEGHPAPGDDSAMGGAGEFPDFAGQLFSIQSIQNGKAPKSIVDALKNILCKTKSDKSYLVRCQNPHCRPDRPNTFALAKGRRGPDGEYLCKPCSARYLKAFRNSSKKKGEQIGDGWRWPGVRKLNGCSDCDTTRNIVSDTDMPPGLKFGALCENCLTRRFFHAVREIRNSDLHCEPVRTITELIDLAILSWLEMHDGVGLPEIYGPNYHIQRADRLGEECRVRGIMRSGQDRYDLVNLLQTEDALNGILPRPSPSGVSQYHRMNRTELHILARDRGYYHGRSSVAEDSTHDYIGWLTDHETADAAIVRLDDGAAGEVQGLLDDGNDIQHTTHNFGMNGSYDALLSLQSNILENRFPSRTPSDGLMCGPNALAASINELLFEMADDRYTAVTPERLMGLVLPEFVTGDLPSDRLRTADNISPEYLAWYERTYAAAVTGNVEVDGRVLVGAGQAAVTDSTHLAGLTRRNDIDYQQMIGMLEVGYGHGILPRLRLGVVTSAYINRAGQEVPALARIVHRPEGTEPVVWVHNNVNYGHSAYNHWEGFTSGEDSRMYDALMWGFRIMDSGFEQRELRWNANNPMAVEGVEARLERRVTRAVADRAAHYRKMRDWCITCRAQGKADCVRAEGQDHCKNCEDDPASCHFPRPDPEPIRFITGNETTDETQMRWNKPLGVDEEQQYMNAGLLLQSQALPTEPFDRIDFLARASSNDGPQAMAQMLADLIVSGQTYAAVLANPNDWASPEVGPNRNLPTHREHRAWARQGTIDLPHDYGNLVNPVLIALVQDVRDTTSLNNPNPPRRWTWYTQGIPGAGCGVKVFGDRAQGLIHFIIDRDVARMTGGAAYRLIDVLWIVIAVESHVVDGTTPSSLGGFGVLSPHWHRSLQPARNKYIIRVFALDMVDRHAQLRAHWITAGAVTLVGAPAFPGPVAGGDPMFLGAVARTNYLNKLDQYILAAEEEHDWRSGWLNQARAGIIHARNMNRNAPYL
ncbi:hypothetical protein LTR27_010158 [Elasticomyces elasticus]|nr:hypothetical protein LTR27_010158 [Elasticomyces elasticus]